MADNIENQLNSIKQILKDDKDPNKPKLIKKGGFYTEKFKKYNRKLIREGKTLFYAPQMSL